MEMVVSTTKQIATIKRLIKIEVLSIRKNVRIVLMILVHHPNQVIIVIVTTEEELEEEKKDNHHYSTSGKE